LTLPRVLTEMEGVSGHMPADLPPLLLGRASIVWQTTLTLPAAQYTTIKTEKNQSRNSFSEEHNC
jgi:hypothetical protein